MTGSPGPGIPGNGLGFNAQRTALPFRRDLAAAIALLKRLHESLSR